MASRLWGFTGGAIAALAFAASAQAADTIKIGMFGPLSGPAAVAGIAFEKGWQYVVKEVNDAGGITIDGKPKKIELVVEDSQSKVDVGLSAAQKLLTRDNVDILVGDMLHSDITLAVMELAAGFPKVFYTGEPTSLDIAKKIASDHKKYGNIWKWDFSSDAYAATVNDTIQFLVDSGKVKATKKTVAVIAEDTGFSKPILENLKPMLDKNGWTISDVETVPIGQADFYPQLSKLRADEPDFVVSIFTAANSAIALTKQLKEQGLKSLHMGVDGPVLPGFIDGAGPAAEGTLLAPMLFDPAHNEKHRDIAQKLGAFVGDKIGNDHVLGYCNAALLVDAIKRAGSVETKKLDQALASTDFSCLIARWVFLPDTHAPKYGADFFAVPSGQVQGGQEFAIWPKSVATTEFKPVQ